MNLARSCRRAVSHRALRVPWQIALACFVAVAACARHSPWTLDVAIEHAIRDAPQVAGAQAYPASTGHLPGGLRFLRKSYGARL